jgi:hypothetical protein
MVRSPKLVAQVLSPGGWSGDCDTLSGRPARHLGDGCGPERGEAESMTSRKRLGLILSCTHSLGLGCPSRNK